MKFHVLIFSNVGYLGAKLLPDKSTTPTSELELKGTFTLQSKAEVKKLYEISLAGKMTSDGDTEGVIKVGSPFF